MRAVQTKNRAGLDRIDTRTWKSLMAAQWIDGDGALTAAGLRALERY